MFRTLLRAWGPQHWWPADSPLEVVVGAYLTQNTSWINVDRAIANLRAANVLTIDALRAIPIDELENLIRCSGYFRQKAQRLKAFVAFLDLNYAGSLERMFAMPTHLLREQLLALNGVGPETADSILLYAGNHEVFVIDAYTRRILERHGILSAAAPYEEIRTLFERAFSPLRLTPMTYAAAISQRETSNRKRETFSLSGAAHAPSPASEMSRSARAQALNEMHALLVGVAKNYCLKTNPRCDLCPLKRFLPK